MTPQEIQKANQQALSSLYPKQIQIYNGVKNNINQNEPFELKDGKFIFKKSDNRKYSMDKDGRVMNYTETPTPTMAPQVKKIGESTMLEEKCGCSKKKKCANDINKINDKKNPIDEKVEMDLDDASMDKYGKEFSKLLPWQKEKIEKFVKNPHSPASQSVVKMKNDKEVYNKVGQVWNENLADRLENIMLIENDMVGTDQKLETPIQGTASVEANKENEHKKEEPKKEEPKENPSHKEFMDALKPTMEKVKANQVITWEELKKLAEMYEKIGV
jgi:hypothetical protein